MFQLVVLIGLTLSLGCHTPVDTTALVLPGGFSQATTIAELQAQFGAANVQIVEKAEPEWGDPGVVLFPNDSTRRAYVSFHEPKSRTDVARIEIRDADSRWRGKHGVHVGMTLAELRRVNGKPFMLSGFDEERRGAVQDAWSPAVNEDDATLGALDVAEGEHMYFGVDLGLKRDAPADAFPHDEVQISSDDPAYPRLGEIVVVTGFNATTSLDDEWE